MRLSEHARSRDNNFTLLRLMAALTVVLVHSSAMLRGPAPSEQDFLLVHVGRDFGPMALDWLFVTSGFLVTASLFQRGDLNHFIWARALRLYPGLWLCLPLTVFVLAPLLSTLPAKDYYASKDTWTYFWRGATLFNGIRYSLPGVFENNPLKGAFNGSLWTLPVELRMYVFCVVGWLAFSWRPALRVPALKIVAPIVALFLYVPIVRRFSQGITISNVDVAIFMFFMGATLYFWRDKVSLSWASFVALPLLVAGAALFSPGLAFAVYLLCSAPFLLHLAYLPGGQIRKVNGWGDYSYGIYIYAFPVQQTLAHFFPDMPLAVMVLASGGIAWALAWCSWRLVEKRAMGIKNSCADATQRLLDRISAQFQTWARAHSRAATVAKGFRGEDAPAQARVEG
jgi:peptidoglycan/LPS O-acetylase OafA/YrhL